jgi:hypothetical protein
VAREIDQFADSLNWKSNLFRSRTF